MYILNVKFVLLPSICTNKPKELKNCSLKLERTEFTPYTFCLMQLQ